MSPGRFGKDGTFLQPGRFNKDGSGLPQNEESVTRCAKGRFVLGGTNDYRGILNVREDFTGWEFSRDGGRSVANEGQLPSINFGGGVLVPSGGDPVEASIGRHCKLFAASLNYDPVDFFPNGVGIYRSTPSRLSDCPGGTSAQCWPTREVVVRAPTQGEFLDKPWIYVGRSAGKRYLWVVYAHFICGDPECFTYTSDSINAVRCTLRLVCTDPILISGNQQSTQFADVTIGPDGRTYVTWQESNELETAFNPPERVNVWMRVAPPGSTTFGPTRRVAVVRRPMGIAPLHANDFRVGTYPKSDVKLVNGEPRVFVVWDACRARSLGGSFCEEPAIRLRYSDDLGRSWSSTRTLSAGGDNYFPTLSANPGGENLAVAWFTNRFDWMFHNRQDVEVVTIRPNGRVTTRQRLTQVSNESEADSFLGGEFIGDYIEVYARDDRALVHFNANYRSIRLLDEGFRVPQQDNYLLRLNLDPGRLGKDIE